jgi:hypothetical protein
LGILGLPGLYGYIVVLVAGIVVLQSVIFWYVRRQKRGTNLGGNYKAASSQHDIMAMEAGADRSSRRSDKVNSRTKPGKKAPRQYTGDDNQQNDSSTNYTATSFSTKYNTVMRMYPLNITNNADIYLIVIDF